MNKARRWKRKRVQRIRAQASGITATAILLTKAIYGSEPCCVCGQKAKSSWDMVYAGYWTDGKRTTRSAHKACWAASQHKPETWVFFMPF